MAQRKDIRLPLDQCQGMTLKQIRRSIEYKSLTPLGKKNRSGSYRYGNKSYLRKTELCRVLDNPSSYHTQVKNAKKVKKNMGPRKRKTRKGDCLVAIRKLPCNGPVYQHRGLTTTGKQCCFKRKQSKKVTDKRRALRRDSSERKSESSEGSMEILSESPREDSFIRRRRRAPLPRNIRKSPITPSPKRKTPKRKTPKRKTPKKLHITVKLVKKDITRMVMDGPSSMTWGQLKAKLIIKYPAKFIRGHKDSLKKHAARIAASIHG